jgi:hypothetical protein
MHSTLNGRADTVGPAINLGSFLPERRTVVINDVSHDAWVTTNRRYPRRIQAMLDTYMARYSEVIAPLRDTRSTDDMSDEEKQEYLLARMRAVDEADQSYQRYVTDSLMALIPTLDEETAELIETETAADLLIQLGYFQPKQDVEAEPIQSSTDESEDASPLTGDLSNPDSPGSILTTASTVN